MIAVLAAATLINLGGVGQQSPKTTCIPHQVVRGKGTDWIVNSVFGARDARQCITYIPGVTGYEVSLSRAEGANMSQVQASPFTLTGDWDHMSTGDPRFPVRARDIISTHFSVRGSDSAPGQWNAAFDEWFGSDPDMAHANGAELMVWLRATMPHYGSHCPCDVHVVLLDRHYWYLTTWRTGRGTPGTPGGWNYIQYRLVHPRSSLYNLNLVPLIDYVERRGLIRSAWWLEGSVYTNELWSGGTGLRAYWVFSGIKER